MLAKRNERERKQPPKADDKENCAELMTIRKTDRPKTQSQTIKIQPEKVFTRKAGKKGGENKNRRRRTTKNITNRCQFENQTDQKFNHKPLKNK